MLSRSFTSYAAPTAATYWFRQLKTRGIAVVLGAKELFGLVRLIVTLLKAASQLIHSNFAASNKSDRGRTAIPTAKSSGHFNPLRRASYLTRPKGGPRFRSTWSWSSGSWAFIV